MSAVNIKARPMKNKPIFSVYQESRPTLITIICIVGFIFNLCSVFLVLFYPNFTHEISINMHPTLPASILIISIATLISYTGVWKMRLWGFILYVVTLICALIYAFMIEHHFWWGYSFSFITVLIFLFYAKYFR